MEERKRSLVADDDVAPPSKRQASAANGNLPRMEPEKEKDVENYQKDAILRQMKEYKREKRLFEDQVSELTKRSVYHDDHLRAIDAWFSQLLDEIKILAGDSTSSSDTQSDKEIFKSALVFEDHAVFEEHLKNRSKNIKAAIADIFGRLPSAPPEVKELQERLAALLAAEKAHIVERQRITGERDQLSERLENASYRYLIAEKKLDRAKSAAVQKLERQAIMGGNSEPPSASEGKKPAAIKSEQSEVNGEVDHAANAAAETARREAMAASEKRKVQLEQLEAENKRLNDDLTSARTRMAVLSDDDYAKTDLFKLLKSQYEDVIKRINDLEAKNVQLREEAQKLQAERTLYRNQVDEESRTANTEMEVQLARAETDLARIRSLRDELASEVAIRKAAQDQQKLSTDQAKELATARDDRISALESEVERLRLELGQMDATGPALDDMSVDDLKTKLRTLENQYSLLSNELPSMEAAWRKTQTLAAKKVSEAASWEEQISRISAEKAKADQKYFAAMKSKEAREIELRALKTQNAKSSEIVSQLKDAESNTRALAINLEKQLSEAKENLTSLSHQNRALQQKVSEGNIVSEGLKSQVAELKKLTTAKDAEALGAASAKRQVEVELEELRVRLEDTRRSLDKLKKQGSSASSADSDDWRRVAICPVCNSNLRNTVLKLCSHVFCNVCVQNLISNRSRKCPSCAKAFGTNDYMPIILT